MSEKNYANGDSGPFSAHLSYSIGNLQEDVIGPLYESDQSVRAGSGTGSGTGSGSGSGTGTGSGSGTGSGTGCGEVV